MLKKHLYISGSDRRESHSTKGMTSKVIKGSAWGLVGQLFPFLVSFFTAPFVIRFLGSEAYGISVLISLIPGYFSFADFGMGLASTKYGSEAFVRGSREDEGKVIRTGALITLMTSLPISIFIFIFSFNIVLWLKIPEYLQNEASVALKITAVTFVLNFLNGIFNTPQLSRLRMDLNTIVSLVFKLPGLILTPIVLYLGGGIIEVALILMISSFLTLLAHLFVSGRLLKELFEPTINKDIIKPLLKFGVALIISGIAATLLVNLEKAILARVSSVKALAYYSVAFTFANIATLFSGSMIQSLLPAFSQLLKPERRDELNRLFSRGLRLNLIILFPTVIFLLVIAKPFFSIWAGEDFGRESSLPFYVLLLGLFFNVIAYIPHSLIIASGRTDILAKVYWIELLPYIAAVAVLTSSFGAVGAAAAWSLRVITDAVALLLLSKKLTGISLDLFSNGNKILFPAFLLLLPLIIATLFFGNHLFTLTILLLIFLVIYSVLVWKKFLELEDRIWITDRLYAFIGR